MVDKTKVATSKSIKFKLIVIPLILVFIAIAGLAGISSNLMRNGMLGQMRDNGFVLGHEVIKQVEVAAVSEDTITEMIENNIRSASQIVFSNQNNLSNEFLTQLARDLDLDGLYWFNNEGEIIYSTDEGYLGWIPEQGHPLYDFMLNDDLELMEDIRADAEYGTLIKYGAVKNPADGTFVQAGVTADAVQALTEQFSYQNIVDALANSEDIVYALIVDTDLIAIADSDQEDIGANYEGDEVYLSALAGDQTSSEWEDEDRGVTIYEVVSPLEIGGEIIGISVIGFSMEEVYSTVNNNLLMIIALGALFFIVLGTILFSVSNYVVRTVNTVKDNLNLMASGDFTKEVSNELLNKKDEFGEISNALKDMQYSLRSLVGNVVNSSEQVASASEELSATTEQSSAATEEVSKTIDEIAKGAGEQATDTEMGSGKANELGEIVENNQKFMQELNQSSEKVVQLKNEGIKIVDVLQQKTSESNNAAGKIFASIKETNDSAAKINVASQAIQSIADQTNLLALNAAIEAARAGEAGKGFAVVADEIRKLAEQSTESAKEIESVVQELQGKSNNAIITMESVRSIVDEQEKAATETGEKFSGIAEAIETTKRVIEKLNVSGTEIKNKKNEILGVLDNLSAIAEENAASTEEVSASAEELHAAITRISGASESLSGLAQELQLEVTKFKV
ncbi:MAG: hypothetical protein APF76_00385 [Desulfitibacter sp. BRH_c19]|nr:MAG: hypothetical protein APF76_00385 [Desulfitibacter sp. BRH_c19]